MVEYFSFRFWGRNIVIIIFIIARRRFIANIGAIDCSEMKKNDYVYATFNELYFFRMAIFL